MITIRMVRRDALTVPPSELFNPWPVARSTPKWLMFGAALSLIVALIFFVLFGLRWSPNALFRPFAFGAMTLWSIPLIAAAEEYAFRGYAFWRLIRLFGFWPAQLVVAGFFAVSHITLGGFALLPALAGTVTGSVLYGVAFARARGIAAPLALHTGWNIAQHVLLSPLDPTATPLAPRVPHVPGSAEYAGMLSVVAIVMVVGMLVLLQPAESKESSSAAA
ncbi:MAG: CPBP family intramembrane glutamic endopeptidase [Gemmatimonadales bacterium]